MTIMKKAPIASRVRKKCPFFPEDTALHQGSLLGNEEVRLGRGYKIRVSDFIACGCLEKVY